MSGFGGIVKYHELDEVLMFQECCQMIGCFMRDVLSIIKLQLTLQSLNLKQDCGPRLRLRLRKGIPYGINKESSKQRKGIPYGINKESSKQM